MTAPLRLREFDHAHIGDAWVPGGRPPVVPESFAGALERLQHRLGIEAFRVHRRTIQATNFVGTVSIAGRRIEVLPKIDTMDDAGVRARLVEMLAIARMVPTLEAGIAEMGPEDTSLLDLYMSLYVLHLRAEWRRGQIKGYRRVDHNRTALKGKLLVAQNRRLNQLHPERFFTRADVFTADVAVSRLLKAGLHVVRREAFRESLRREATELLTEFEDVADGRFTRESARAVTLTRQHARFQPLVALARMLVDAATPDTRGNEETFALLFDMNRVFEQYVGELLRLRVCPRLGLRTELQVSGQPLLVSGSRRCFNLYPDVGIWCGRELLALLDTKWKRLDPDKPYFGVSQADVYQAYAYGKEYRSPLVVLLYPHASETQWGLLRLAHGNDPCRHLEVSTLCVADPPVVTVNKLEDWVRELAGVGVPAEGVG